MKREVEFKKKRRKKQMKVQNDWKMGKEAADSLVMSHPQLRQIRELLDPNDGVVQRWLERLGHGVGQDHSNHHRQDV